MYANAGAILGCAMKLDEALVLFSWISSVKIAIILLTKSSLTLPASPLGSLFTVCLRTNYDISYKLHSQQPDNQMLHEELKFY